jgi:hypothetical protein
MAMIGFACSAALLEVERRNSPFYLLLNATAGRDDPAMGSCSSFAAAMSKSEVKEK